MSRPLPPEDAWKTPEIREAESALDRTVSKSRELLKNLEKIKLPPLKKPDTPERIEALKNAASRPDAPPELRRIKQKVDAGEFSWQEVAAGKAFADPEVRELASARLGEAKEILDELEDGASPEQLLEAHTGSATGGALLDDRGRAGYAAEPEQPQGYSNDDPLHSSSQPDHSSSSTDSPPEAPAAPPPPEAPRHRAPEDPDEPFSSPLADRQDASGDADAPVSDTDRETPPSTRRTRRDDPPDSDDDYFGNSFLR